MANAPNSIMTLKEYYGDRLHVGDQADLLAELLEGNDRSAIVTMTAICDSGLEARIAISLPTLKDCSKKQFDHAFRHDGALGSLSARIDMAYYMGLLDEKTKDQLHDMRHIRNAVAHTSRRVTFADAALRNAALRILYPAGMHKLLNDTPNGFLRSFIAEGMLIWQIILHGRNQAIDAVRKGYIEAGRAPPF